MPQKDDPLGILEQKGADDPLGLLKTGGALHPRTGPKWIGPDEPGLEEPWVPNPFEMVGAIGGAGMKLGLPLGRAALSGIVGATAEYPIGLATEEIEPKHPHLALPFNIITGVVSGITIERAIEKGIMRVFATKGIRPSQQGINLTTSRVKQQLKTGTPGPGDDFAKGAAEEINKAVIERPESKLLRKEFEGRFFPEKVPEVAPKPEISPITKLEILPGTDPPIRKTIAQIHGVLEEFPKPRRVEEFPAQPIGMTGKAGIKLYGGLPFNEIPELWTKTIGGPLWDKAVMKGVPKLLEKIPGGRHINRALLYEYRGRLPNTPGYIRSLEDMRRYQAMGRDYAIDLGKRIQEMPERSQLRIGEYIRGEIEHLPQSEVGVANEAKRALYDLGKQSVELGLLSEEVFFRNAGRYMPRLYTSKEYTGLLTRFGLKKPMRLDLSRFRKRKDIPKEIREAMGEILTPGYPVAKGINQLTHDVEMSKFFKGISENPEWSFSAIVGEVTGDPIPPGFKQLPQNLKLGPLSGRYVHPEIFKDIQETVRIMETPERVWRQLLGLWKVGKIVNPKTMARNLFGGNVILSHLGGFPLWRQPVSYIKGLRQIRTQGDYFLALRKRGVLKSTWAKGELQQLFSIESELAGLGKDTLPEGMAFMARAWERMEVFARKGGRAYQVLEEWSKLAHFIDAVERRGMSLDDAAQDAQKWLFDYGKVTRFQEKYRTKWYGAPFATFTFKALPRIAEATMKTPWRLAPVAALIYGVERAAQKMIGDTPEEIEAKRGLRPDWQKGTFLGIPNFARVPLVDDFGREHYWNLTYWLPWGDIAEGGGFGPIPGSLVPLSQPFVKEGFQQIVNYDTFWKEPIVREEETAGKTGIGKFLTEVEIRGKHLGQTLAPTIAVDITKGVAALRGRPDYRGRERHPLAVGLDVFAGIKLYPVDYSEQMVRQINKIDPKKGSIARKIHSQIKGFAVKRAAMKKKGKSTDWYDRQMAGKIKQIQGLAKELQEKTQKAAPAFKGKTADPLGILGEQ